VTTALEGSTGLTPSEKQQRADSAAENTARTLEEREKASEENGVSSEDSKEITDAAEEASGINPVESVIDEMMNRNYIPPKSVASRLLRRINRNNPQITPQQFLHISKIKNTHSL
jgi:hypothetical protein